MEAVAHAQLVTAEEFWKLCADTDDRLELVDGRVVRMSPVGPEHGRIDRKLVTRLGQYVEERGLGEVYLNTGFILRRSPDVTRGPDEAFVAKARAAANPPPERGFWPIVPDLAVEIVSPDDTASDVNEKVRDYLESGVRVVWVVYPRTRQVHVCRPTGDVQILFADAVLEGEDVLPGFRLPLAELWGTES